jgi:hypothetical protein
MGRVHGTGTWDGTPCVVCLTPSENSTKSTADSDAEMVINGNTSTRVSSLPQNAGSTSTPVPRRTENTGSASTPVPPRTENTGSTSTPVPPRSENTANKSTPVPPRLEKVIYVINFTTLSEVLLLSNRELNSDQITAIFVLISV